MHAIAIVRPQNDAERKNFNSNRRRRKRARNEKQKLVLPYLVIKWLNMYSVLLRYNFTPSIMARLSLSKSCVFFFCSSIHLSIYQPLYFTILYFLSSNIYFDVRRLLFLFSWSLSGCACIVVEIEEKVDG